MGPSYTFGRAPTPRRALRVRAPPAASASSAAPSPPPDSSWDRSCGPPWPRYERRTRVETTPAPSTIYSSSSDSPWGRPRGPPGPRCERRTRVETMPAPRATHFHPPDSPWQCPRWLPAPRREHRTRVETLPALPMWIYRATSPLARRCATPVRDADGRVAVPPSRCSLGPHRRVRLRSPAYRHAA